MGSTDVRPARWALALLLGGAIGLQLNCQSTEGGGGDPGGWGNGTPGGGGGPGTGPGSSGGIGGAEGPAPFPAGCAANNIRPTAGQGCTAACADCECSSIKYTCDKGCYAAGSNCQIAVDANGTPTQAGGDPNKCTNLSCTPENDLSKELSCTATKCPVPQQMAVDVNRQPRPTGILFTLDTSGSMEDDLMNTACAAKSFTDAASVNGAKWTAGTMTMDMDPWTNKTTGAMTMPGLAQTVGACTSLTCQCPGTASGGACNFSEGGKMINNTDPNAVELLKQHLVLGTFEQTGNEEAGLEKAMNYIVGLWKLGRRNELGMVFVVSDEEADSDKETCGLQALRAQQLPQFQDALGAGFTPPANNPALSCQDNLIAFYKYFYAYVNVQVHALVDTTGSNELGRIYMEVAKATGGQVANLFACQGFNDFFTKAGTSSATLSTNICFPQALNPATVKVTYTEGGRSELVPASATDGWQYDAALKCVVFTGSWQMKYGSYHVAF